ncbi:unnamed protein product [Closterium sp. NIES-64]|nr:unnamed protein product [Closterium sp. NIES-64]
MSRSLRLRPGDLAELFDGQGSIVTVRLESIDRQQGIVLVATEAARKVPFSGPQDVIRRSGCLDFGRAKEGRSRAVTKAGIGRKNEVYTENNSRALHATRPRRGVEGDLWGVDLAEEIQIWEETINMKIDEVRREGKIIEKNGGVREEKKINVKKGVV